MKSGGLLTFAIILTLLFGGQFLLRYFTEGNIYIIEGILGFIGLVLIQVILIKRAKVKKEGQ